MIFNTLFFFQIHGDKLGWSSNVLLYSIVHMISQGFFASTSQQKKTTKEMPSSSTNTYSCCVVCKGNHRMWECRVFKERLQPRELSWWLIINSSFRAYATNTHSGSALNQESVGQKGAIVRLTHYCIEQTWFFQQNNQQIPILSSLLATQVKLKQLLDNGRLIKPQQCHQLLMLRAP